MRGVERRPSAFGTAARWAAKAGLIAIGVTIIRKISGAVSGGDEEAVPAGPPGDTLSAGHETRDTGHVWVAVAGALLWSGLIALLVCLWNLQSALGRPPEPPAFRPAALAHMRDSATVARFQSRAPGLFPDPEGDRKRYQAEQEARAPGYGWVDRRSGVISIPVDRAMERIAERGLPHWEGIP